MLADVHTAEAAIDPPLLGPGGDIDAVDGHLHADQPLGDEAHGTFGPGDPAGEAISQCDRAALALEQLLLLRYPGLPLEDFGHVEMLDDRAASLRIKHRTFPACPVVETDFEAIYQQTVLPIRPETGQRQFNDLLRLADRGCGRKHAGLAGDEQRTAGRRQEPRERRTAVAKVADLDAGGLAGPRIEVAQLPALVQQNRAVQLVSGRSRTVGEKGDKTVFASPTMQQNIADRIAVGIADIEQGFGQLIGEPAVGGHDAGAGVEQLRPRIGRFGVHLGGHVADEDDRIGHPVGRGQCGRGERASRREDKSAVMLLADAEHAVGDGPVIAGRIKPPLVDKIERHVCRQQIIEQMGQLFIKVVDLRVDLPQISRIAIQW